MSSWDDSHTDKSVTFSLGANQTAWVSIRLTTFDFGYGKLSWSQSSDMPVGLVAHAHYEHMDENDFLTSRYAVPINNGQPF